MNYLKNVFSFVMLGFSLLFVVPAAAQSTAVLLLPDPPKVGKQAFEVKITDTKGKVDKKSTVDAEAVMPPMPGMGKMSSNAKFEKKADGVFVGKFNLSMEGTWYLKLKVNSGAASKDFIYKISTGSKGATLVPDIPNDSGDKNMNNMHH